MLPTEDLFVYVYVLVDDAIGSPGRRHCAPAGSGASLHRR